MVQNRICSSNSWRRSRVSLTENCASDNLKRVGIRRATKIELFCLAQAQFFVNCTIYIRFRGVFRTMSNSYTWQGFTVFHKKAPAKIFDSVLDINDVVLVSWVLTLNRFQTLPWCFQWCFWTNTCRLSRAGFSLLRNFSELEYFLLIYWWLNVKLR